MKYAEDILNFVQDCYYEDALKDVPQLMTMEESAYNLACLAEDEYTDVPADLTAESFMAIWNILVTNHGRFTACRSAGDDVEYHNNTREENKMEKRFGSEKTSLHLTDKARSVYIDSTPLEIYEYETSDGLRYRLAGIIESDNLTAEEVNAALEELAQDEAEEEKKMTKSELITAHRDEIREEMLKRYRTVAGCRGSVQYKLYIWEDGELEWLEGPQGDNSWLQPRQGEPRQLYYVTTVDHPCFDPWDLIVESRPDDDAECAKMEQEAIDYAVDCYEEALDDRIDGIIDAAEQEEQYQ